MCCLLACMQSQGEKASLKFGVTKKGLFILLLSWSDLTLSAPLKHGTKRSQRDKQRNYQSSNRAHKNLAWPYWQTSRATHHQHYHQKPVSHVSLDSTSAMRQNCEMQHGVSDVNQAWEITQEIFFFLSLSAVTPGFPETSQAELALITLLW